ncbi:MAG TPA: AAA family ATPase [Saprospiraceae bacterium]|nr:AAA family ATPase [Saprospiraceae bacterium]
MSHYPDSELHKELPQDNGIPGNPEARKAEAARLQAGIATLENEYKSKHPETTEPPRIEKHIGLFTINTASGWVTEAMNRSVPGMLFDTFWYEGELCILYATTGVGKSVLAVQIADSISRGLAIPGFELGVTEQPVLYIDYELSDIQFAKRYVNAATGSKYDFSPNLYRLEINPEADIASGFLEMEFMNSIKQAVTQTNAKIVIVDNLTYLKSGTEKAAEALPLMKTLNSLKKKLKLSILCLAHTPKRDKSRPITENDLQGSKMLSNHCDCLFAIGESSRDSGMRYLKQIKTRNTEKVYDWDNVVLCTLEKPDNFLGFRFLDYGTEGEHLRVEMDADRDELKQKIKKMAELKMTQRDISKELGISLGKVNKMLKPD